MTAVLYVFEGAPRKQERGMGASVVFVCYGLDNQSVFLCQSYTFLEIVRILLETRITRWPR